LDANPVAIRQLDIFLMMQNLQVVQAHGDQPENRKHQGGQRRDSRFQKRNGPVAFRDVELRH
jgi:hypothetical protein